MWVPAWRLINAVPVVRSEVEVLLGSTTTISVIVQPGCMISVTRYLPGANSPLFQTSPLPKLKAPSEAELTKVNCAAESVGQVILTTEIEPPCGGACAS
jgi:hypothetical protein